MIVKILLLVILVRLLLATQKPLLCAGLYTGITFLLGLALGASFPTLLIRGGIGFAMASLYFWLLNRFEDDLVIFFIITGAGILIAFV